MPPKKAPAKKEDKHDDQSDPVPKNECGFKVGMETKHEAGHYFKVKFDWIQVQGDAVAFPQYDSGFFKDWNLVQIEGEEPKPPEAQEQQPVGKGAPPKKGGAPAKPDPKKGGLEEITDNRPRTVTYLKDFATEPGFVPLKVTEDIAKRFETTCMKLEIISVNRENLEESVRETIELDLSCLLFPKDNLEVLPSCITIQFVWTFHKLKSPEIHFLSIKVSSEQGLLSDFLRKKLNPLQLKLVGIKDIPYKLEHKYKPIYSVVRFVDNRSFKTVEMPQQPLCKYNHKHVFLMGTMDQVMLKEMLTTNLLRVELHDCDEYVPKEDEDEAVFSYGCAKYTLKDFLRPYCKELKLRSDVFPVKKVVPENQKVVDLNTTARKNERTIEKSSPYLIHGTYAVIIAELAHTIGSFNEELELKLLKQPKGENEQSHSQLPGTSPANKPGKEQARPGSQMSGQDKGMEQVPSSLSIKSGQMEQEVPFNENDAIFERAIIIIPYKSPETVKQIEQSFERINLKGLGFDNVRYLNTKEFSEEERKDRKLDFIGGFCLMDAEMRMYVIEGLGGQLRGLNQFYLDNERQRPNDKKYKLIYNPEVRFKNRMYLDFNVQIKKIKMREPITKIMGTPDVYLRSKVPDDIYDTLQKFAEIRKLDRMHLVRNFNLFPEPERLLNLERKYGDALSYEDLYGLPQKPKRRRNDETGSLTGMDETMMHSITQMSATSHPGKAVTIMEATLPQRRELTRYKAETDCRNIDYEETMKARNQAGEKDLKKENVETVRNLSQALGKVPRERMNIPEGVEVFQYGNQKLNIWEFQKEQMRKEVEKDPSNYYTYAKGGGADFLTLAFPLVNENEIQMKAKEENESKWKTKSGFDTLIKKESFTAHPKKPPQSIVDDLQIPYVDQVKAKETALQYGQPFSAEEYGKDKNFQKNFRCPPTFGDNEYFKTVFISGDDMVREQLEQLHKEHDDWRQKVVVSNTHFTVNQQPKLKTNQIDKHKNMLEEEPKKVGLRMSQKKIRELTARQVFANNKLENAPSTIFANVAYEEPIQKSTMHQKDLSKMTVNRDFNTNIKNDILSGSPLSKKVFIQ